MTSPWSSSRSPPLNVHITKDRSCKALGVALDPYASINPCVKQCEAVGLEQESLVDGDAACCQGRSELFPQLNVHPKTGEVHSSSAEAAGTAGSADPCAAACRSAA